MSKEIETFLDPANQKKDWQQLTQKMNKSVNVLRENRPTIKERPLLERVRLWVVKHIPVLAKRYAREFTTEKQKTYQADLKQTQETMERAFPSPKQ